MIVLVCGGTNFFNFEMMKNELGKIHQENKITKIIHGNALGADRLAGVWAFQNKIECQSVPAQWSKYGKRAGPIRNKNMLGLKPDLVVAFPGKKGTKNMINQARKAGVKVIDLSENQKELEI